MINVNVGRAVGDWIYDVIEGKTKSGLGRRQRMQSLRQELADAVEGKNQAVRELDSTKRQLAAAQKGNVGGAVHEISGILGVVPGEHVVDVARRRMRELLEARQEAKESTARSTAFEEHSEHLMEQWKKVVGQEAHVSSAKAAERRTEELATIDILFDGPPGPSGPRFLEVERAGRSVRVGTWVEREGGRWALRLSGLFTSAQPTTSEWCKASDYERPLMQWYDEDVVRYAVHVAVENKGGGGLSRAMLDLVDAVERRRYCLERDKDGWLRGQTTSS